MAQYDGSIRINTKIDSNGVSKGVSAVKSSLKGLGSGASAAQKSIDRMVSSVKKLGAVVATAFISGKIAQFGKEAVEAASDLEAMNAQFSQVFGNMEAAASKSLSQIADQAGITEERMKASYTKIAAFAKTTGMDTTSSMELANRAMVAVADSAAFYDRSLEETTESLQSFLKGNYENDAALGLSATEYTRNAAANKLYGKSFIELSEAQKQLTLLQMVEDANKLSGAMGQASREADTWTNQTGILNQAWTNLKANLGKFILPMAVQAVKAITNVINSLNALLVKLSQTAGAFRSFSELLTGNKASSGNTGAGAPVDGSDYSDAAAGAEQLADATDDAAKATKKAKKEAEGYLSPLDEINKIGKEEEKEEKKKKPKTDGLAGAVGKIDYGKLAEANAETPFSRLFDRIKKAFLEKDWEGLGKEAAKKINKGLKYIYDALDWKKIGPKITKFIRAFTRTLNSLVDNIKWDLMGRTVGRGINDIVKIVNLLIDSEKGIDFVNIGQKLSQGFRGLVGEINWTELGNMFGNWFMVSWDTFKGFVDDMWRTSDLTGLNGWQELGNSLAEGVAGLFEKIDFGEIGTSVANAFNGVFEMLKNFVLEMDKNGTWDEIARNISSGLNNMIHGINWAENGKVFSDFVTDLLGTILEVAKKTDWEAFGRGIGEFLSNIDWDKIFKQVFDIITEVAGGFVDGFGDTTAGKFLLAFGAVKLAIKSVDLVKSISGILGKLKILGSKVTTVGELAANSSVNWATLTKAIGLATAGLIGFNVGMKLTEVTTSANQDLSETSAYLAQFSAALAKLSEQDKLTSEQQTALNNVISELADKGASPVEALTTLRDALSDAKISSSDLSSAAKNAGVDLSDLVVALKDTESGGEVAKKQP